MKIFIPLAAAVLLAASTAAIEPLVVDTPLNATVCEPLLMSWSGGTPPYALTVAQILFANAALGILDFSAQTGNVTSFTWVVNITDVDNSLVLNLVDGAGNFSESLPFTVHDSSNHSCLIASTGSSSPTSGTIPTSSVTGAPSTTPVHGTAKSSRFSEGEIWGIGLGVLASLLLLAIWRLYILRTRRRLPGDRENLGIEQKFQLSPLQKQ